MANLMIPIRARYGTRAAYNTWVAGGGAMMESELGYITDESILLLGTASGTPLEFVPKNIIMTMINNAVPVSIQTIIKKLSESSSGQLLYNGVALGSSSSGTGTNTNTDGGLV